VSIDADSALFQSTQTKKPALRQEQDDVNDLIRRLREHAEDYHSTLESWREAFSMELTDDGWTWQPFLLRDELLNGEIFYTLKEAQIVIENWRRHYNTVRPHSSLGYRPPVPEALVWPAPKEIVKMKSLN
jgi:hypothetical protein